MTAALFLLAGLALLVVGSSFFVSGGVMAARRFHVSPLLIGLTITAWGTSAPELLVSLRAGAAGEGAMAIGNVVGSNIFNIGMILGLSAMIHPIRVSRSLIRRDVFFLLLASAACWLLLLDGDLGRLDGLLLLAGFIVLLWVQVKGEGAEAVAEDSGESAGWFKTGLFTLGGLALLVYGADLSVGAARTLSSNMGLDGGLVGLFLLAAGTSLPELATSAVAAFKGEVDLAAGNLIGSNLFNILAILGLAPLLHPLSATGILPADLAVMLGFVLLALPLMRSSFLLSRLEGALLALAYTAFLLWRAL
jgi:cation:H+ antiporter